MMRSWRGERVGHLVRIVLPEPDAAVDVGDEEGHDTGRKRNRVSRTRAERQARIQLGIVIEDPPLELLQSRTGIDTERFDQRVPGVATCGERAHRVAGAIARDRQLLPETLVERMARDRALEHGLRLAFAIEFEENVGDVLDPDEIKTIPPVCRLLRPQCTGEFPPADDRGRARAQH